jgi:hypothetical protein
MSVVLNKEKQGGKDLRPQLDGFTIPKQKPLLRN